MCILWFFWPTRNTKTDIDHRPTGNRFGFVCDMHLYASQTNILEGRSNIRERIFKALHPRRESATPCNMAWYKCRIMLCFRQTHHLDCSCCVFDRHIIWIEHVVCSTDTSSGLNMLCFGQTHHLDWTCCFGQTHHLDWTCCVFDHRNTGTIIHWPLGRPTPLNTARCGAL